MPLHLLVVVCVGIFLAITKRPGALKVLLLSVPLVVLWSVLSHSVGLFLFGLVPFFQIFLRMPFLFATFYLPGRLILREPQ